MKSAGQAEAAEWLVKKAESYGLAQYYATQEDWNRTKGLFEALAEIEDRIVECIWESTLRQHTQLPSEFTHEVGSVGC